MTVLAPFQPAVGKTQSAAVSGPGAITGLPSGCRQLVLTNIGTVPIFFRVTQAGDATAASLTTDMPVLPNSQVTISKDGSQPDGATNGWSRLAYNASGAGSTLYVTPGEGW